jgi:serine/threonine protein kinase
MPMDSLEKGIPDCAPHPLEYRLPRGDSKVTKSATDSSDFETQYDQENHSLYYWQRYLRVDHSFTLDSVLNKAHGNVPGNQYLCRKTFAIRQAAQITDQASSDLRRLAQIEAKILKTHKHRHIVAFSATYQDGDRLALLTVPVTPYDLREYLSMVELQQAKEVDNDWGHWRTILRTAPGCLAGAVSFLHKQGIVHGDISPENIIVDFSQPTSKVCLANFGRAAIIKYVKDLYMLSYDGPESKHPVSQLTSHPARRWRTLIHHYRINMRHPIV